MYCTACIINIILFSGVECHTCRGLTKSELEITWTVSAFHSLPLCLSFTPSLFFLSLFFFIFSHTLPSPFFLSVFSCLMSSNHNSYTTQLSLFLSLPHSSSLSKIIISPPSVSPSFLPNSFTAAFQWCSSQVLHNQPKLYQH